MKRICARGGGSTRLVGSSCSQSLPTTMTMTVMGHQKISKGSLPMCVMMRRVACTAPPPPPCHPGPHLRLPHTNTGCHKFRFCIQEICIHLQGAISTRQRNA